MRDSQIPLGYEVIKLAGDAHYRLIARLSCSVGDLNVFDPDDLTEAQVKLTKKMHVFCEWKEIIEDNKPIIQELTGIENLMYQKEPYLRIARPFNFEDNIGIHRDTHYGATKDEWVLWVPLTQATDGAELRILPESHLRDDEYYPWVYKDSDVKKGSDKHWLGFRYRPKVMELETESKCLPISCRVGEAILFNCACVHGQKVNKAPWTRFSIDIRLTDRDANVQRNRGLHGDLYV